MYEQPSPRRIGPGLVAMLALLGAVAGTMAYLVTRQMLADRSDPTASPPRTSSPAVTTDTAGPIVDPTSAGPTVNPTRTRGRDESRDGDGESCPKLTADAVAAGGLNSELRLLLYVEFRAASGPARAWICRNADDVLIYQAHERSSEFDAADNAINTLMLAEGIKGSVIEIDAGYLASNPGQSGGTVTEYTATEATFTIELKPNGPETTVAVDKVIIPG
jgi:hypothetical protein